MIYKGERFCFIKAFAGKNSIAVLKLFLIKTHIFIYSFGEAGLISLRLHLTATSCFQHDLTSFSRRRDITIERTKSNNLRLMKRTTFKNIGLNNYEIKYYSRQHGEKHFVLKKRKGRATFLIGTILPRPSQN